MAISPIAAGEGGAAVRAKLNDAIAQANLVAAKADASAVTAESAARALGDAAETAAREYALTVEGASRAAGDAAEATTRATQIRRVGAAERARLGEAGLLATADLDGAPDAVEPLPSNAYVVNALQGSVVMATTGNVAPVAVWRIEAGRQYRVRFVVRRHSNPNDPAGDAVRLALRWLDAQKAGLRTTVLSDLMDLTVADGRVQYSFVIAGSATDDAEAVAPAGGLYVRPFVRPYGGVTHVEVIDVVPLTDAIDWSPDVENYTNEVAGLAARQDALEDRVNAFGETAGPYMAFDSEIEAEAAEIPQWVKTIRILNAAPERGGPDLILRRTSAVVSTGIWLRSADRWRLDGENDELKGGYWDLFGGVWAKAKDARWVQKGVGAVISTIDAKLKGLALDPREFGAPWNNLDASLNTSGIMRAVNEAASRDAGGIVLLPAGAGAIDDDLAVPGGRPPVVFMGEGEGVTVVRQVNPSKGGISFIDPNYYATGGGVENCTIEAGAGFVTTNFYGLGSSGTGINATRQTRGFKLKGVGVHGFADGVKYLSTHNTENIDLFVQFFTGNGLLIDKADGESAGAGNSFKGGVITNVGFTGVNTASRGLRVRASGGEWFDTFDILGSLHGVSVDPRSGDQVSYLWFNTILADTCTSHGWLFDASAGYIYRQNMSNSWGAFCGGAGIVTKGPYLFGLRGTLCGARENFLQGWDHQGGRHITWVAPDFNSNGRSENATYPGAQIFDGAMDFAILGGTIGNNESAFTTQAEGIKFLGAATRPIVKGVNFANPGGGARQMSYTESLMVDPVFEGNVPPECGGNHYNRRTHSNAGLVTAGLTGYIGPAGIVGAAGQFMWRENRQSFAAKMIVIASAAPGAGQSFTATLFKNGAATSYTATISGSGDFDAEIEANLVLVPNDGLEVRVVGSASAASAIVSVLIVIEPR